MEKEPVQGNEDETNEQDRLRWNHSELRREAKDLRIIVSQTPENFPNRERLFQIADEVLSLVPIYDQIDEDSDERSREELAESIKRAQGHIE